MLRWKQIMEEKKATVWSQTKEDRWYPGGFFEEVCSLLENSHYQTDLNSWVGIFSVLVLTLRAHPAVSVNRYFGSYLAKMPLSCSTREQPDLLSKYSSHTSWNSQVIMRSPLYLGNSTGRQVTMHPLSSTVYHSVSNLCCSVEFWISLSVLIFKAQICSQDAWMIAKKYFNRTAERCDDWCQQLWSTRTLYYKVKLICREDYRIITSRKGATA